MNRIVSWERGSEPSLASTEGADDPPLLVIHLSIDIKGLQKFERLTQHPLYQPPLQFDNTMVFIIVKQDHSAKAVAHFKVISTDVIYLTLLLSPSPLHPRSSDVTAK